MQYRVIRPGQQLRLQGCGAESFIHGTFVAMVADDQYYLIKVEKPCAYGSEAGILAEKEAKTKHSVPRELAVFIPVANIPYDVQIQALRSHHGHDGEWEDIKPLLKGEIRCPECTKCYSISRIAMKLGLLSYSHMDKQLGSSAVSRARRCEEELIKDRFAHPRRWAKIGAADHKTLDISRTLQWIHQESELRSIDAIECSGCGSKNALSMSLIERFIPADDDGPVPSSAPIGSSRSRSASMEASSPRCSTADRGARLRQKIDTHTHERLEPTDNTAKELLRPTPPSPLHSMLYRYGAGDSACKVLPTASSASSQPRPPDPPSPETDLHSATKPTSFTFKKQTHDLSSYGESFADLLNESLGSDGGDGGGIRRGRGSDRRTDAGGGQQFGLDGLIARSASAGAESSDAEGGRDKYFSNYTSSTTEKGGAPRLLEFQEKDVRALVEMGFSREAAVQARIKGYSIEGALTELKAMEEDGVCVSANAPEKPRTCSSPSSRYTADDEDLMMTSKGGCAEAKRGFPDEDSSGGTSSISRDWLSSPQKSRSPERGRLIRPVTVTWTEDPKRRGDLVLIKGQLPESWSEFTLACMKALKLDPATDFLDEIRVTYKYSYFDPYTRRVEDLEALAHCMNLGTVTEIQVVTIALDQTPVHVPNIGPREDIASLANDFSYNPAMQAQITELGKLYPSWRRVRGDGNCYYRALMFGLLERAMRDPEVMRHLLHIVVSLDVSGMSADIVKEHQGLIEFLHHNKDHLSIEEALNKAENGIDRALVRVARFHLSNHIREHADDTTVEGGLSMNTMIETESVSLEEYLKNRVETMGIDAEGFALDMGLLPARLNVRSHTWMLQRNSDTLVQFSRPEGGEAKLDISLLFVPGHYSFLTPAGEHDAIDDKQNKAGAGEESMKDEKAVGMEIVIDDDETPLQAATLKAQKMEEEATPLDEMLKLLETVHKELESVELGSHDLVKAALQSSDTHDKEEWAKIREVVEKGPRSFKYTFDVRDWLKDVHGALQRSIQELAGS